MMTTPAEGQVGYAPAFAVQTVLDMIGLLFSPGTNIAYGIGEPTVAQIKPVAAAEPSDEKLIRKDFLLYEALVLGGIVGAPVIYRAAMGYRRGKKKKVNENMALALEGSSARATALLAALGPAIGFPMAYMTVQCLEARGVISKGLGDSMQTLMAAAATGQAASGVGGLISSLTKVIK